MNKALQLVTRLCDTVDVASRVDRQLNKDLKGDTGRRKALIDHFKKVVEQAVNSWGNLNKESLEVLVSAGVVTTMVYEIVISA